MRRWQWGVNLLGIIAGAFMVLAMFFPWWSFRWEFVEATKIFPYLVDGPGSELVGYRRSPLMTILTVVLIVSILVCLVGSLMKRKAGRIMLGASGVIVLLCGWRLLARVGGVAGRFGLPLVGHGRGSLGGFAKVEVWTWLEPGIYIIAAAGLLALLAALLHPKIWVGE